MTPDLKPLKLQGITALISTPVLLAMSFGLERNVMAKVISAPPLAWASVLFAGVVSTIGASALLFWLVQRREAGRVTPYFLLTPLVSCTLGVLFLGDHLSPQLLIGGAATMLGVGLVALTEKRARAEETLEPFSFRWNHLKRLKRL